MTVRGTGTRLQQDAYHWLIIYLEKLGSTVISCLADPNEENSFMWYRYAWYAGG